MDEKRVTQDSAFLEKVLGSNIQVLRRLGWDYFLERRRRASANLALNGHSLSH
jgi:hypothetical protein